jgi:hypothetical protein
MVLESTPSLTEMSKGCRYVGLIPLPPSWPDCLETWGPVQACRWLALPFITCYRERKTMSAINVGLMYCCGLMRTAVSLAV